MKKILVIICLLPQLLSFSQQLKSSGFKEEWHICLTTGLDKGEMAIFFTNPNVSKYTALMMDANGTIQGRIPLTKNFVLEAYSHSRYTVINKRKGYALLPSKTGNYFILTDEKLIQEKTVISDPALKTGEILNVRLGENGNPQWLISAIQIGQTPDLYLVEYDLAQHKIVSVKLEGNTLEKVSFGGKFVCKGGDFNSVYYMQWPKQANTISISQIEVKEKVMTLEKGSQFSIPTGQTMKAVEVVEEYGNFDSNVVASITLADSKGKTSEILFLTKEEDFLMSRFPLNKMIDTKSVLDLKFGVYNCTYGSFLFSRGMSLSMDGYINTCFFTSSVADLNEGNNWEVLKMREGFPLSNEYNGEYNFDHAQIFSLGVFKDAFDPSKLINPNENSIEFGALSFSEDKIQTFLCLKNEDYIPEYSIIEFVAAPSVK